MILRRKNLLMLLVILTFSVFFVGFSTSNAEPVASTAASGNVLITEICICGSDGVQRLELYNNHTSPVDITGWQINTSSYPTLEPELLTNIEANIVIPVGGYVVIYSENTTYDAVYEEYGLDYYRNFYDYGDIIFLGDDTGNLIDQVVGQETITGFLKNCADFPRQIYRCRRTRIQPGNHRLSLEPPPKKMGYQSVHHTQQSGLPRTRSADHKHRFSMFHTHRDPMKGFFGCFRVNITQCFQFNHGFQTK